MHIWGLALAAAVALVVFAAAPLWADRADLRLLSEVFAYIALASLCQTYSTMVKAQEQLNKSGILFKTPSGYPRKARNENKIDGAVAAIIAMNRKLFFVKKMESAYANATEIVI